MISKVGSPVTGEDFFDREEELAQLWADLRSDDILLLAPRRVGKTSLMFRLRDTAQDHDTEAVYLSVAGIEDEGGFVRELYKAIATLGSSVEIKGRLAARATGGWLKRLRKVSLGPLGIELDPSDPWDQGAALVKALDASKQRRLILLDEVPIFILTLIKKDPSGDRARKFLYWFRDLRQRPERQGSLRWLLAGSIGLDTVTARLRMGDTVNDLYVVHLGPFDRETARQFLIKLSETYELELSETALEHLLDRVGWLIPYHLQLLFKELQSSRKLFGTVPSQETVDEIFDGLLSPSKRAYFDYWRQRLEEELGQQDAGLALLLLSASANDPNGVTRSTLSQTLSDQFAEPKKREEKLRYLLDVLESDGYLVAVSQRYRFRSPLLREFWLRRVVS